MENLTTGMNSREYAALAAEAERLGMSVDELATQLARDAMAMRYRKVNPAPEVIPMPMEKIRASKDPAGGRHHEPEKSETDAPFGAGDSQ